MSLVFRRFKEPKRESIFLSVSRIMRQIASEASVAVCYKGTVKIAVSLVKSQILGCLGHVALVHTGRRPLFVE